MGIGVEVFLEAESSEERLQVSTKRNSVEMFRGTEAETTAQDSVFCVRERVAR